MTATPRRLLAIKKEEKHIRSARAPLSFELLHDLEELIIDLGLVAELGLDLVEVEERVLDLRGFRVFRAAGGTGGSRDAAVVL